MHYLVGHVLAFVTWVWFGFELQRRWTFRVLTSREAFRKFLFNQVFFLGLGSLLLWTTVEVLNVCAELAYLMTLGVVTAAVYLSSFLWVFRQPNSVANKSNLRLLRMRPD